MKRYLWGAILLALMILSALLASARGQDVPPAPPPPPGPLPIAPAPPAPAAPAQPPGPERNIHVIIPHDDHLHFTHVRHWHFPARVPRPAKTPAPPPKPPLVTMPPPLPSAQCPPRKFFP